MRAAVSGFVNGGEAVVRRHAVRLRVCVAGALQVGTLPTGEIDYDELRERLAANVARPAIINVNIGTTVRGAVDDLDRVLAILQVSE